jgi:hypothetical protein
MLRFAREKDVRQGCGRAAADARERVPTEQVLVILPQQLFGAETKAVRAYFVN